MKIALALPMGNPYTRELPEIALGYLASVLRERGHEVLVLTRGMRDLSPEAFLKIISEFRPALFGMRFLSPSFGAVQQTAAILKQFDPTMAVIAGGPHPTGEPVLTMQDIPELDFAFSGESEGGLPLFAELLEASGLDGLEPDQLKDLPGLIWREGDKVHVNVNKAVENLDEIPFPAWDLMDPRDFNDCLNGAYQRWPIAPIVMTRGCPFLCTFCQPVNGRSVRYRTAENVVEEMTLLNRDYGVGEFDIYDSNASFSKKFLLSVCNKIMDSGLDIAWTCPNGVRLNSLDEELLNAMRRAGCYSVSVGIESGSPEILKRIKKSVTIQQIRDKVKMIRSADINVHGLFIIGFPEESREQVQKTFDLAMSLPLTRVNFHIFNPLPGTDLYDDLKAEGRLDGMDWSTVDYYHCRHNYSNIPSNVLEGLERKYFLLFHLRPRILWSFLTSYPLRRIAGGTIKAFRGRFFGGIFKKKELSLENLKSSIPLPTPELVRPGQT